ncbi:MAG: hypothetical protein SFU98_06330 [Leptospiraceae bacterium]|nr:hypothetical protein [Leptospiraceae bacterium]
MMFSEGRIKLKDGAIERIRKYYLDGISPYDIGEIIIKEEIIEIPKTKCTAIGYLFADSFHISIHAVKIFDGLYSIEGDIKSNSSYKSANNLLIEMIEKSKPKWNV